MAVVGGGDVAARKVRGLLEAGARVTVISPELHPELAALAEGEQIDHIARDYQDGDLAGNFLVITATDDPETNRCVWNEANQLGILVNVADDPPHCNFILPAIVRRGALNIAISTGGSSPALARRLREQLESQFGVEYQDFIEILGELRPELLARFDPGDQRLITALELIDSDLLTILRREGREAAELYARDFLMARSIQEG